jgi:TonB family protein
MRFLIQAGLVTPLFVLSFFFPLRADEAKDLQELLKHKLLNHVVKIRNSYGDDHLSYDSQGNLLGSAQQDCPNATQLKVGKVEIKKNVLVLRGPRVVEGYDLMRGTHTQFQEQSVEVQIDIELGPAQINEQSVADVLKKVFLTTADIPKDNNDYSKALRVPVLKVRAVPSNTAAKDQAQSGEASQSQSAEDIGRRDVTPPVAVYSPDPEYPAEGQKKKRQGDVILWAVIDEQGKVAQVKVSRCIGAGLDEAAVQAVSQWRFKPARRNGQPVSVQINIDVNFHL